MSWFRRKKKIPTLDLELETKTVECEVRKIKVELDENMMPPYDPPSDKEILEQLEFCDYYEAAYRLRELKKENAALKGKLTKLQKKTDAYKEDLDRANAGIKELISEKYDNSRESK
jgi:hypothetical protein